MTVLTGRLSMAQIAKLADAAGFPRGEIPTAVAVAWAESTGDPTASNTTLNRNGSRDDGLWQINSVHGYDPTWLHNPANNAAAAYHVWRGGGWAQWTGTYAKGAHERFMPAARAATLDALGVAGSGLGAGTIQTATSGGDHWWEPVPVPGVPGVDLGGAADALGSIADGPGAVVRDLFHLNDLWQQVMSVGLSIVFTVAGLALIALGLYRLTGTNPADVYSKASSIAGPLAAVI